MIEQKQNNSCKNCRLQIFTFGQFKIQSENGKVYNISSRSNKLWNLFKFLLINIGKYIPQEIILEHLYPDKIYEDPENAIHNMIYRLRKVFAKEQLFANSQDIISFSNGCYKLDVNNDLWLDFNSFEGCIKNAEDIKTNNPARAIELYKIALDIYMGEFLPELIIEDWVIPKRTYFNKLYIQSLKKLSELYSEQHEYDLIVQICKKALLNDPYEEEIHMHLVENLLKIGKFREAKKHYEEMVKAFEKQFGISPTNEMLKIEQMLKSEFLKSNGKNESISKDLLSKEKSNGAFYCGYRDFYTIYTLEKRRSERSGEDICPISINFNDGKNIFKSETFKLTAVKQFKVILLNSLRRGDTFTLVNKTRFFILLPNMGYNQARTVMNRVISRFKGIDDYQDINVNVEACSSLPQKVK